MRWLLSLLLAVPMAIPACAPTDPQRAACDRNAQVPVSGAQPARSQPLAGGTTLAAHGALWTRTGDYPVSFLGSGPGACVVGGTIIGEWPESDPWTRWHGRGALRFSQPGFSVLGVHVFNAGDGVKVKDDAGGAAQDFVIQGSWIQHAHDDCIENDYLHSGVIRDDLLDGCYVLFSARPWFSGPDGRTNHLVIDKVIGALEPMRSVYRGPSPGSGGFFKWSSLTPSLVLTDNVLMARQLPNTGTLGPPPGPLTCSGNVIVWEGPGPFPEAAAWLSRCPDTVITTDPGRYAFARAAWLATHPSVG